MHKVLEVVQVLTLISYPSM